MLSRPDLELVARDQSLPGLATVLDPLEMVRVLRRFRPEIDCPASIEYVRYKPGTSCLVGYRVRCEGSDLLLGVYARRPDSTDKLAKIAKKPGAQSPLGSGNLLVPDLSMAISVFPNDPRLKGLKRIAEPEKQFTLLSELLSSQRMVISKVEVIRYRPARRCVLRVTEQGGQSFVVKFYDQPDFALARQRAVAFTSAGNLRVPELVGESERGFALASEWLAGATFKACHRDAERVGRALVELHQQSPADLPVFTRSMQMESAQVLAEDLGCLWPPLAARCSRLANVISVELAQHAGGFKSIHGDFYADQVLVPEHDIGFVDFDEAAWGSPAWDIGNFSAHLVHRALSAEAGDGSTECSDVLLQAYCAAGGEVSTAEVRLQTALGLLRLAPRPFRERHSDWPDRMEAIVARAEELLPYAATASSKKRQRPVDPQLPLLAQALEPRAAERQFQLSAPALATSSVVSADLIRHKQGRRCLIEYEVVSATGARTTLLGKMHARGVDRRSYRVQRDLWQLSFGAASPDGIAVAEPVAIVPALGLWLQRQVAGETVTSLLEKGKLPDPCVAAAAIAKMHNAQVRVSRRWSVEQEVDLLRDRLRQFAVARPELGDSLGRLMSACEALAKRAVLVPDKVLHRDFYPDNLLFHRAGVALIDLDLVALGDPAVDVGNFLAHVTELSLRRWGEPDRFSGWQSRFQHAYCTLSGSTPNIRIYELLTLVRLAEISTRLADRRFLTDAMLELCKSRLGKALEAVGEQA
ncbi:MAG TPA: aminoglycoside phosphotransferase family protein [Chloroflexota bacterium]|nr:aminoglycoside phosphotransferase family protein [Chloroflexota bacterium]